MSWFEVNINGDEVMIDLYFWIIVFELVVVSVFVVFWEIFCWCCWDGIMIIMLVLSVLNLLEMSVVVFWLIEIIVVMVVILIMILRIVRNVCILFLRRVCIVMWIEFIGLCVG